MSLGVAVYPQHGHDKHALISMRKRPCSRRAGRSTVVVHDQGAEAEHDAAQALRDSLRAAIEDSLLSVEFQTDAG